jgi:hypothetical protein
MALFATVWHCVGGWLVAHAGQAGSMKMVTGTLTTAALPLQVQMHPVADSALVPADPGFQHVLLEVNHPVAAVVAAAGPVAAVVAPCRVVRPHLQSQGRQRQLRDQKRFMLKLQDLICSAAIRCRALAPAVQHCCTGLLTGAACSPLGLLLAAGLHNSRLLILCCLIWGFR